MSEQVAIRVRDLHKEFLLNHSGSGGLKTMLLRWKKRRLEHLHVLKGISFEVPKGQCVAVVGRNGAGKSTLLSLLARVYKPTSGSIEVHGRIAPLLELGAGFHPDLTGLENIVFNGVVLGLSRKEVQERIDQIIEFSELQNQIDVPVRTYSSGMLARLGFSVAVNIDAEVLLVDEVLAVGDFEFAEKCYRRIQEFRDKGGTILFVSHQFDAVERVADRCIWLREGNIVMDGPTLEVTKAYHQDAVAHSSGM